MLNRRSFVVAGVAFAMLGSAAQAQSWKAQYPELTLAVVPAENASGVSDRYAPFVAYLSKELGVPVKVRVANDYAAVIEGQRAGNIHIAFYGPASYSTAFMTGVKTEPFVTTRNNDGSIGYYSVIYAVDRALVEGDHAVLVAAGDDRLAEEAVGVDSRGCPCTDCRPSRLLQEEAGRVVAGGRVGIDVADGLALEVAANWWNADDDSNLTRMVAKGMVKKEDFRIIFKSGLLPGSPYARLSTLPDELKAAIAKAFTDAPTKDKAAFDRLSDGKDKEFVPVTHQDYAETVEMIEYVNDMRKKRS
jgi:phosphonate transport system substrate-binding protein